MKNTEEMNTPLRLRKILKCTPLEVEKFIARITEMGCSVSAEAMVINLACDHKKLMACLSILLKQKKIRVDPSALSKRTCFLHRKVLEWVTYGMAK